MKVRMYDVKFGECIMLYHEQENLLVDFGCDSGSEFCSDEAEYAVAKNGYVRRLERVAEDIVNESSGKDLSVLLSHFHDDHINGFLKTKLADQVQVKNLYIPNVVEMNITHGKISALQMSILHDIFEAVVLQNGSPKITLYSLLLKILDVNSKVQCVCFLERGKDFEVSKTKYDVLWPCFKKLKYHSKTITKVLKTAELLGLAEHIGGDGEQTGFDIVNEFAELIGNAYGRVSNSKYLSEDKFRLIHELLPDLDSKYQELEDTISKFTDNKTLLSVNLQKEIKATIRMMDDKNKVSIVFQDRVEGAYHNVFMTGDALKSDLEWVIQQNEIGLPRHFSNRYLIVKAPHHGTPSHYTPLLPNCHFVLISNGKNRKGYGRIAYEYGGFLWSNRSANMVCTNQNCELLELDKKGKGHRCICCDDNKEEHRENNFLYIDYSIVIQ